MHKLFLILTLSVCCFSCKKNNEEKPEPQTAIAFNSEKWSVKENDDYQNRESMIENLISSDTLKKLNKAGIFNLLGEPDRIDNNHFFYQIDQSRIGSWPVSTKMLVIKMKKEDKVEWVKIHG